MAKIPISFKGFGPIPRDKRAAVIKDGVRRINGRQVDLLRDIAGQYGWTEDRVLVVVQECCTDVQITELADCVDGPPMQEVVRRLKGHAR